MLRCLIACEMSGRIRTRFAKRGWDAWSADILPDESGQWVDDGACSACDPCWGQHYQGDVMDIIRDDWDLVIAHPPCTDLSAAGARYWKRKREDGRQQAAIAFFMKCYGWPPDSAYVVTENPVGIMSGLMREPEQKVQPWMFGDPLEKQTCHWYRNALVPRDEHNHTQDALPALVPTHSLADYPDGVSRTCTGGGSWRTDKARGKTGMNKNWEDSQGRARRNILRSITPEGFARAAATQWGAYIEARRS